MALLKRDPATRSVFRARCDARLCKEPAIQRQPDRIAHRWRV